MTDMITARPQPPLPPYSPPTLTGPRGRRRLAVWLVVCAAIVLVAALAASVLVGYRYLTDDSRRDYLGTDDWPQQGQAAVQVDSDRAQASPGQKPAPIASMAKVMTAHLVLQGHPLAGNAQGFRLRVTDKDVRRTDRQRSQDQSVVRVEAGEVLTERDALMALLLPSANNVAVMLARRVAGTVQAFVRRMNVTARELGMRATHYADPSGYSDRTVSTAADQLRLARVVATNDTFSAMAATRSYDLPTGTVHNTDELLGHDGFVGTKTGSHDAAGGCFMFRVRRVVDGRPTEVLGVVMGQHGHSLIRAGLYASKQLVDRTLSEQ